MFAPKIRKAFLAAALVCLVADIGWPAKKKKDEDETQVLQLPKELPTAVVGETRRLAFYVTPLSGKGLLSQQIRDALKSLEKQAGGYPILHIRAFVAGTGDLRRVRDLVSETFTDRRQPLPALSLVQAGGLPLEGAQVVLEGIAGSRKEVAPGGLAFVAAQTAYSDNPYDPAAPLAEKSIAGLRQALQAAGADGADALRVTCFLSSLDKIDTVRSLVQTSFPRAASNFIQTQRAPSRAEAACEAVAALRANAGRLEVKGSAALVGAPRVVLSGTQVSFGAEEADARLAFERLGKALEPLGASLRDVAFVQVYPVSHKLQEQALAVGRSFFEAARPPAETAMPVEGLSSQDAGFGIDVVAVKD